MALSARNQLPGVVESIQTGNIMAHVVVKVGDNLIESVIPIFIKHSQGKQQCHMVLLYFVRGWSCDRIAQRYDVTRQHSWQIVSEWRRHAVALGYLQVIPQPEALAPLRFPSREVFQTVRAEPVRAEPVHAEAALALA